MDPEFRWWLRDLYRDGQISADYLQSGVNDPLKAYHLYREYIMDIDRERVVMEVQEEFKLLREWIENGMDKRSR